MFAILLPLLTSLSSQKGHCDMHPEVHVGIAEGDLCGRDHRVLQAAVDYIAGLGGGTVYIGPGEWMLRDSIQLRSNIVLIGTGAGTVLKKAPGGSSLLAEDGDYGDVRVRPLNSTEFAVGDGVTVRSDNQAGFHSTVATVIHKGVDGSLTLDGILNADFMVAHNAMVSRACPLIRAVDQANIGVHDLVLDGNRASCPREDSCRGGGINLLRVANVRITGVTIRHVNGDGLSYQNCPDVTVEDCIFEENAGGGCHPGSGSSRPVVQRCVMRRNGGCGIFICWRVQNGRFVQNVIEDNAQMGISIGHKDTDNRFLGNEVRRNGFSGIYFREEAEHAAGHRCLIEKCLVEDNGLAGDHNSHPSAGIRIDGYTNDIVIRDTTIRDTRTQGKTQAYGILLNRNVGPVEIANNRIEGHLRGELLDLRSK